MRWQTCWHRNRMFNMGGNQIGAKTLDLNVDFKVIAAQLDKIAEEFFRVKAA